jgi:plasmid stabilization system protein ParE
MPRYILSPIAADQFEELLYNIAEHSGWDRSMRVEEQLYAAFSSIAGNPGVGHLRKDLLPREIYFLFAEPYYVLYLRDRHPIHIIAILHASRDIASLMLDKSQ